MGAAALLARKGAARPASPADTAAARPAAERSGANSNGRVARLVAVERPAEAPAGAGSDVEAGGEGGLAPPASLTAAHFLRPWRAPESDAGAPSAGEPAERTPDAPVALEPTESLEAVEPALHEIKDAAEAPEFTAAATEATAEASPPAEPESPALEAPMPLDPAESLEAGEPTLLEVEDAPAEPDLVAAAAETTAKASPPATAEPAAPALSTREDARLGAAVLAPTVRALNAYPPASAAPAPPRRRRSGTLLALAAIGAAVAVVVGWTSTSLPTGDEAPPLERLRALVTGAEAEAPQAAAASETSPAAALTGEGADYLPSADLPPKETAAKAAEPEPAAPVAPSVDVVRIEPGGSAVIAGTGAPRSALIVLDKGEPIGSVAVDGNGQWVLIPDRALPEGDHEISLVVKDEHGTVRIPERK